MQTSHLKQLFLEAIEAHDEAIHALNTVDGIASAREISAHRDVVYEAARRAIDLGRQYLDAIRVSE